MEKVLILFPWLDSSTLEVWESSFQILQHPETSKFRELQQLVLHFDFFCSSVSSFSRVSSLQVLFFFHGFGGGYHHILDFHNHCCGHRYTPISTSSASSTTTVSWHHHNKSITISKRCNNHSFNFHISPFQSQVAKSPSLTPLICPVPKTHLPI